MKEKILALRCELLSDCIFDLLNTTVSPQCPTPLLLWIAFRLYLWLIEHNDVASAFLPEDVVNCFQIVSLTYWTQQPLLHTDGWQGCELLSDCIFDLLNTTICFMEQFDIMLWIAFRLYLWLIEHNAGTYLVKIYPVVNCFQIVSLTYWTQPDGVHAASARCCELLSDCIFDLLNTTPCDEALQRD